MSESRRAFLCALAAAAAGALVPTGCGRERREEKMSQTTERMPVLFVGHGSPMNAIEDNEWSRGFAELRGLLPRPKAVLAISAHWYVPGTFLTADEAPRTIHDFGGFPRLLYEIEYPAAGSVDLARRVRGLLGEARAGLSHDWGLDHGTWTVLRAIYPEADVPVVQLSLDRRLDLAAHFELARSLAELREEGVLVFGSGNVVHNLRDAFARMRSGDRETPPWATRFDEDVKEALLARDSRRVLALQPETEAGREAHPTLDHFLPLLYALGASDRDDEVSFPIEGFDLGSISMRSVRFG